MWREFEITNEPAVSEMAAFVRTHEKGHFLQMPYWSSVKTFWKWRGISVYHERRLVATMGILVRPLPLGFTLFYIPRGPVCDRNNPDIWNELVDALKTTAKSHHALLVYMDPDELDDNNSFRKIMNELRFKERSDNGFANIQPQNVLRLSLTSKSEEDIYKAFCPKTRYNIGLSKRNGVTVSEYSGASKIPALVLEQFHSLMEATGKRDHFIIRNSAYFQRLLSALQEDARIYIAYLNGQPIAGSIEVFCGNKAWYLYGASANEHRNTMPNYLLQWTMICRAMEKGCDTYDFRGVPGNPQKSGPLYGLYRFKKGFSGTHIKFSGLFTYYFHPISGRILGFAMRLRQKWKTKTNSSS